MLQASASLLAGGAVGAGLVSGTAEQARAADAQLTVAGDEVTVRNQSVAAVWLNLGVEWSYSVPSGEQPQTLVLEVLAGPSADNLTAVATTDREEVFLEASDTQSFEADVLEADGLAAADLVPSEGGEAKETTVHIAVEMRLRDESDLVIAADSQATTATVTVTKSDYNPDEHGSVSGTGELTVEVA